MEADAAQEKEAQHTMDQEKEVESEHMMKEEDRAASAPMGGSGPLVPASALADISSLSRAGSHEVRAGILLRFDTFPTRTRAIVHIHTHTNSTHAQT